LTTLVFSVKQSSALTRAGLASDSVIPLAANLRVNANDGWTSTAARSQLSTLLNVATSRFLTTPNFTYNARLDPAVLDANNKPTYIATITGLAYQDGPISLQNLVVPEYIMHSDGILYQVYDINFPFIDQIEVIVGQSNRVYGAFSKSHPAFNVGGQVGALSGTLTLPKTLRSVGSHSFANQTTLTGNLTVAGINLTSIGSSCFLNAYTNGRTLLIMGKVAPSIGSNAFFGTGFSPITIRSMTSPELIMYAY
jgi:hypothetical protein